MKYYSFHYIKDKTKEKIDKRQFECYEDALEFFSQQKRLSIDNFLKIYIITTND